MIRGIRRFTRLGIFLNVTLMTLLAAGLWVVVNAMAGFPSLWVREDLTRQSTNSLAPQTIKILKQLPGEVQIFSFVRPDPSSPIAEVLQQIDVLLWRKLRQYHYFSGGKVEHFKYRLDENYAQAREKLEQVCEQLTQRRQQAATRLQKRLVGELQPLGMSKVAFEVQIKPITPMAEGADQITFLFSPDPGEPLHPLAAIASGGEMSRFLLAMKAVFTQVDPVATMVFDEIDAGVSGKMAQAIGTKLSTIAQDHQLLCVTHQPLVAALADQHMRVSKQVKKKRTVVQVDLLSEVERREELAQLTAGHSAQEAMGFVDSLLAQAAQMRDQEQRQKV